MSAVHKNDTKQHVTVSRKQRGIYVVASSHPSAEWGWQIDVSCLCAFTLFSFLFSYISFLSMVEKASTWRRKDFQWAKKESEADRGSAGRAAALSTGKDQEFYRGTELLLSFMTHRLVSATNFWLNLSATYGRCQNYICQSL